MNLHRVVSSAIGAVNPNQKVTVQKSAGNTVDGNYKQVPAYDPAYDCFGQVQELTTRDLRQLEALNVQGSQRAVYLNGRLDGVIRVTQKGGDLITIQDVRTGDTAVWLTTQVLEQWPDWVKVSVTLQVDAPSG